MGAILIALLVCGFVFVIKENLMDSAEDDADSR